MKDPIERADALAAIALGDTVNQLQAKILAIPAANARAEALKEAADAWAAYKAANTTVAHWEAVARLDAALITEKQP